MSVITVPPGQTYTVNGAGVAGVGNIQVKGDIGSKINVVQSGTNANNIGNLGASSTGSAQRYSVTGKGVAGVGNIQVKGDIGSKINIMQGGTNANNIASGYRFTPDTSAVPGSKYSFTGKASDGVISVGKPVARNTKLSTKLLNKIKHKPTRVHGKLALRWIKNNKGKSALIGLGIAGLGYLLFGGKSKTQQQTQYQPGYPGLNYNC